LEEVLTYWTRWNASHPEVEEYLVRAFDMLKRDEEEQLEFFHDISSWREKYIMLQVAQHFYLYDGSHFIVLITLEQQ
jgi:hypothetical protein